MPQLFPAKAIGHAYQGEGKPILCTQKKRDLQKDISSCRELGRVKKHKAILIPKSNGQQSPACVVICFKQANHRLLGRFPYV